MTRSICSVAKDYLAFLILPGLLGLAVVCLAAIAADVALGPEGEGLDGGHEKTGRQAQ